MDHIVYLDYKAKELENIINGQKNMIIRGAMGRKLPYGRVNESDILFFIHHRTIRELNCTTRLKHLKCSLNS